MYLLGFDIGSSSVKVSLLNGDNGVLVATAYFPSQEMEIKAIKPGWAEQDPQAWWENLRLALASVMKQSSVDPSDIGAIGISYQMHGLVMVDRNLDVIRPSIIWCDSRAATIGDQAFQQIGSGRCLSHLLNSPGNFTASKLKWVKDNEPGNFEKIWKVMLPGDYIAMKLTGEVATTITGLSEGMFWDFKENRLSGLVMDTYGFDSGIVPELVPVFGLQGELSREAAQELGLKAGTKVCYRAGDQPNNALSLNVLQPGEVAATAGTSGVVYGVSDQIKYDPQSRVNTFAHVNHSDNDPRLGVLLCINGTGILNAWLRKNMGINSYEEMNQLAMQVPVGSEGVTILPFGNGAERVLGNKETSAHVNGISFNVHNRAHLCRAAQEGIVFAFKYGMDIMQLTGITTSVIRAGNANMFLSPLFRETLANVTGAVIELYNTDGAAGAARGAGVGCGFYPGFADAFRNLTKIETIEPERAKVNETLSAYQEWAKTLEKTLGSIV